MMELIQEFLISPEMRRCCWYGIAGIPLIVFVRTWFDTEGTKLSLGSIFYLWPFWLILIPILYALSWRLRVAPEGLARRQFLHWDEWTYSEMQQRGVFLIKRTTLYDPLRPWWCRKLNLEGLSDEDLRNVHQIITIHVQLREWADVDEPSFFEWLNSDDPGVVFFFSMLGLTLANCGWWWSWQAGIVCSCFAPPWFIVASAYCGLGPRVFGKRLDGTHSYYSQILLAPYFWLTSIVFRLHVLSSSEPALVQVQPNLYFGRRLLNREVEQSIPVGWIGVLDLACEFSEVSALRKKPHYLSLPILDATAPSPDQIQIGVTWLKELTQRGPVYVHCAVGHGRSATLVIAFLLTTESITEWSEGLSRLQALRPGVKLNTAQVRSLKDWSDKLNVRSSSTSYGTSE